MKIQSILVHFYTQNPVYIFPKLIVQLLNTQPDNAAVGVELDILAICLSPGKGIVLKNSSDTSKLEMFAICPSPGKGIVLNKSSDTSKSKNKSSTSLFPSTFLFCSGGPNIY